MKKILFTAIIISFVFSTVGLANAETSTIKQANIITNSNEFNFLEYFADRQDDLAQVNRDYLIITMGVFLGLITLLSILFYLINIRPSQQEIKQQKEEIKLTEEKLENKILSLVDKQRTNFEELENTIRVIQSDSSERIETLTSELKIENKKLRETLEEKFNTETEKSKKIIDGLKKEADKKMFILEKNYKHLDLSTIWNEQYLWSVANIHTNRLVTLIEYLEKGVEYNTTFLFDLCFGNINKTINIIDPKDYDLKMHSRIIKVFEKIEGYNEKKDEILKKARELIEK